MMKMMLFNMKNDCYLDDDGKEEEDGEGGGGRRRWVRFGTSSLSIVIKSVVVVNAPNWIFTHLKCIVNATYFICIAMHFLLNTFCK